MTIGLDHVIVPSHNRLEAAKFLAGLLSVPWEESQGDDGERVRDPGVCGPA